MAIALTPDQERQLQQLVDKGHYESVDAALVAALELLEERDRRYEPRDGPVANPRSAHHYPQGDGNLGKSEGRRMNRMQAKP